MGLIELHFHDADFSLGPSFGDESDALDADRPDFELEEEDSSRGPGLGAVVVGVLFLLVLAVAVRKYTGDSPGVEVEMNE
jgi:hypothetical protein